MRKPSQRGMAARVAGGFLAARHGLWNYGRVQHGLLLLQVEHQPKLRQGQAGGPAEAEEREVQVHSTAAQPPVV